MKKISDILCGGGIALCATTLTAAALNPTISPWCVMAACGSLILIGVGHSIRKTLREERDRLD